MTETLLIPASLESATERLVSIDGLVTAKEWQRAAIVAAFVEPRSGEGRPLQSTVKSDSFLSPGQFAALNIAGLRSINTVRRYHDAWMRDGRQRPVPGEPVPLPDEPFPVVERAAPVEPALPVPAARPPTGATTSPDGPERAQPAPTWPEDRSERVAANPEAYKPRSEAEEAKGNWDVMHAVMAAAEKAEAAARVAGRTGEPINEHGRTIITAKIHKIRNACDFLESWLTGGGIDRALTDWLEGETHG